MSSQEIGLLGSIKAGIAGNQENCDGVPQSREIVTWLDESTPENDVRYGIADCRKRLRNQRATLRAHHHPPTDVSSGRAEISANSGFANYAEILATVSMNQSSLSRLVECLLDSGVSRGDLAEESREREEAALT
jgi:hypothetical protein